MAFAPGPDEDNDDFAPLAEINVTPFIDVMLVLLIIFMVTAPMLTAGIPVDLPAASAANPLPERPPVLVTIDASGAVSLGDQPIAIGALAAAVRDRLAGEKSAVQVRGDRSAKYENITIVLDTLAAAGLTKIALVMTAPEREMHHSE